MFIDIFIIIIIIAPVFKLFLEDINVDMVVTRRREESFKNLFSVFFWSSNNTHLLVKVVQVEFAKIP